MCYPKVAGLIKENVHNKIYNFLLKNGMMLDSIKKFNNVEEEVPTKM